jgi:hypothetical protein
MFWHRKKKARVVFEDNRATHIPLPVLIRQVIYDSMLMPAEEIAESMGLPPISDEVAEMEERASQERLEKFSHLIPFIDSHADICSKIAISAYLLEDDLDEEKLEKYGIEDLDNLTKLFRLVSLSASLSCISTLMNLDLIEEKGKKHSEQ